jgi:hypothetical protein
MIKKNIFKNNKKIFDKILNTYPDILLGKHTCQV